jgi:hypothetical protein
MGEELPKKGLENTAKGGNYLNAGNLPARGAEFRVTGVDWEPNFKKTENVPVLLLSDGHGPDLKYKVTNRASAQKLLDAGVTDDLAGAVGLKVYLIPAAVTVAGASKTVAQIAEVSKA